MNEDEKKTPDLEGAAPTLGVRTRIRTRTAGRQASSRAKKPAIGAKKGRPKGGAARPFPRETLERAVSVAVAIRDKNGGKPWTPQDVANAVNLSAATNTFFYLAAAARDYGLTAGGRDSATIAL